LLLDLILVGLATWRLSSLLVSEDGPFDVFVHVRRAVGAERPGELTGLATLFTCVWCMSVWIGALLAVAVTTGGDTVRYGLLALSASTIAITLDGFVRKN
jgi:hypothetical protein